MEPTCIAGMLRNAVWKRPFCTGPGQRTKTEVYLGKARVV